MGVMKHMLLFTVVQIVTGSYEIEEHTNNTSRLKPRVFEDIISSPFFVDKTLLIKEFLQISTNKSSTVMRVLTPPKFGKTINNNMVKRFLEIPVDEKGELLNLKLSKNYELFSRKNLTIFKDDVFKTHFGKHPVISINCSPLKAVTNFNHMIDIYRNIIRSTFSEHKYLLAVEKLWQDHFNKSSLEFYFDQNKDNMLHKYYIFCGFTILSGLLNVHFGKPVYVFVDDFDAIEDCPAYVTGEDKRRIYNFVNEVNNDLLFDNEHLAGALLVGSLRKVKKDQDKRFENKFDCSPTLWRHYGLSEEELKLLLKRFIKDVDQEEQALDTIIKEFSGVPKGYNNTAKHQPCSMVSVEHYITGKHLIID